MAQVLVRTSVTVRDEWGTEASSAFYAQAADTNTLAALATEVATFVEAFDDMTDGVVLSNRVTLFPALPTGMKTSPVAGSRVEQTGLLGFSATGSSKGYSGAIPALSNDPTVLTTDRIVLFATAPAGGLIFILTTIGTVLAWCNEHGQQITAFIDALVSFRKKRKQLQRSSFEL